MLRRRETTMFSTETAFDLTITHYLQLRRSLGRVYGNEERVLASVRQFLVAATCRDLDYDRFLGWCTTLVGLSATSRNAGVRLVH